MLTIGEVAAYAGVTVRTVRHYHAVGLLPEPRRDRSGYRRYDADAVVDLIRIKVLAEAGVPLSRVAALLDAGPDDFAAGVAAVDSRLRAEIRSLQAHRRQVARLAAGENLALPPEAVAYLDRLRSLGFAERFVQGERDAWILVAARLPEQMAEYMASKDQQLDDPDTLELYRDLARAVEWAPDDDRLPALVDRLVDVLEQVPEEQFAVQGAAMDADLADLLDSVFVAMVPAAPRILDLLEERGWSGWTNLRPLDRSR